LGSLLVTHPFHPLCGQRLDVLSERRCGAGRSYVCDGGRLGWVELPEEATDRGPQPGELPLSFEVLVEVVRVVTALDRSVGVRR
jgi:hypothetical protein